MTLGRAWLGAGLLTLAFAGVTVLPSQAAPAIEPCPGVWVVVDAGDAAGTTIACARSHRNGFEALRSAGFHLEQRDNMICRIDSIPDACNITMTDYWSYWHASRAADGTVSEWIYSSLGANSYTPRAGEVEGWFFGQGGRVAPERLPSEYRSSAPAVTGAETSAPSPAPSNPASLLPGGSGSPMATAAVVGVLAVGAGGLLWWRRRRSR